MSAATAQGRDPLDQLLDAYHLRDAIVQMTIRYGSSQQLAAYAERRLRDGKGGAEANYEHHRRAARRQFAAIQRLADRIPAAAQGGAL